MAIYVTVAPSDATTYAPGLDWLYVGAEGDITLVGTTDATPVVLKAVPAGTQLQFRYPVAKIMAATTATLLVGAQVG